MISAANEAEIREGIARKKKLRELAIKEHNDLIHKSATIIQRYFASYHKRMFFYRLYRGSLEKAKALFLQRVYRGAKVCIIINLLFQ
jgi:hypothetical protein